MWNREELKGDNPKNEAVKVIEPVKAASPAPSRPVEPPPPAPAPVATERAATREEKSEPRKANVGSSVVIKGELTGSEDLTVDGRVEGKIHLPDHVLTVGPNAEIKADVVAKLVTVYGRVIGSIAAREKVEIGKGGSLQGDLSSPCIAIQEGALFNGKADMSAGQRKSNGAVADAKATPRVAAS